MVLLKPFFSPVKILLQVVIFSCQSSGFYAFDNILSTGYLAKNFFCLKYRFWGDVIHTFSIIIPVKHGLIPRALERLESAEWASERFELLIAEGQNPSMQRNQAARQAKGQIIYFLDDDSMPVKGALQRLESHFRNPGVVATGGPSLTPKTDSLLQRAFGAVLSSFLGAGGVRNRYRASGALRQTTERELILCNLAVRRQAFIDNGGFDERLYPNEENELLDRLAKKGGILLHDPELAVERSQRSTIPAFVKQMYRYGRGRAEQTRIAGMQGVMPFVPLLFLCYLFIVPFVQFCAWKLPLVVYLIAVCSVSIITAFKCRTIAFIMLLPLLFPLLHIANGFGLLAGFLFPVRQRKDEKPLSILIRCVREL